MSLETELGFDLYGRYAIIRDIVSLNVIKGQKSSILDVGGRGNILRRFLPDDNIVYLDPYVDSIDDNFVKGDGCNMPFEDESFDWVVSADVFEHIPQSKREIFLMEQHRVARRGVIIVCPFYNPKTVIQENRINKIHNILFGESHPWLKEHIQNGLPKIDTVLKFNGFKNNGISIYKNNTLLHWDQLHILMMLSQKTEIPIPETFNQFYNKHYNYDLFCEEDTYRQIVFIRKDEKLQLLSNVELENVETTSLNIYREIKETQNLILDKFIDTAGKNVQVIENNRIIIGQKEQYINELRRDLENFKIIIEQKEHYINEQRGILFETKNNINILQEKTLNIQKELEEKRYQLILQEKDIKDFNLAISTKSNDFEKININIEGLVEELANRNIIIIQKEQYINQLRDIIAEHERALNILQENKLKNNHE